MPGRARALAVSVFLVTACDVPTRAPLVEQRWVVPVDRSTISVADLLPAGVSISGGSFAVNVGLFSSARMLGSLCSACSALQGLTVPFPPFSGSFSASTTLPTDVASVVLASGSVELAIRNGLAIDPLANGGRMTITLTDGPGGREVARLDLGGATGDALPAGATLTRTVTLVPGSIGSTLTGITSVMVTGGQVARIDNDAEVGVTVTPSTILVSSARLDVSGEAFTFETVEVDVEDVDFDDHVQGGAVLLDVANPFGVGLSGQVRINHPGGVITKSVGIGAGARSTVTIAFTAEELKAFLGSAPVTLSGSGIVAPGAGTITVTPQQVVEIEAKIQLNVQIGG